MANTTEKKTLKLGDIVMTCGVDALVKEEKLSRFDVLAILQKHTRGDWGESRDKELNDQAMQNDDDLCMGVHTVKGIKLWVITEWNRSVTTVLLPDEY